MFKRNSTNIRKYAFELHIAHICEPLPFLSQNSALLDAEMELARPYIENIVISSYSE